MASSSQADRAPAVILLYSAVGRTVRPFLTTSARGFALPTDKDHP
jgi:hypothetical protein